jgi:primase-polymerase (primpol)-like protein
LHSNCYVFFILRLRKYEERDGSKTKIPYNPKTGNKAQSNNPSTWTDFDFANEKSINYDGIGFMFADGICGIDIDNKTGNPEFYEYSVEE